jgi:hypothetical protein
MDKKHIEIDPTRVPDVPTIKESTWLSLAIAAGLISILVLSFLLSWSLQESEQGASKRLEILKLIGAACVTIVTLLTVIWRGAVTTRQADQQFQQIEQQIRQNDAKDEEILAKLLIDGTKLVTDKDEIEETVLAGIVALETVITAPNGRFASQAMDILGGTIQHWFNFYPDTVLRASIRAVDSGVALGRYSKRRINVSAKKPDGSINNNQRLVAINGFAHVKYVGGVFLDEEYSRFKDLDKVSFSRVEFDACNSILSSYYLGCVFLNCKFSEYQCGKIWQDDVKNCDFSGARTVNPNKPNAVFTEDQLEILRNRGNYYYSDNPPEPYPGIVWSDYLEARDPL